MEMYYVTEYTPACRFKEIINSTLTICVDYFKNLQLECILHYIAHTYITDTYIFSNVYKFLQHTPEPHRWCNGQCAPFEYGRSQALARSDQMKDYEIGICCFSAKYAALRKKSKDWLARNQDNVSEWGDMSINGQLFQ